MGNITGVLYTDMLSTGAVSVFRVWLGAVLLLGWTSDATLWILEDVDWSVIADTFFFEPLWRYNFYMVCNMTLLMNTFYVQNLSTPS